MKIFIIVNICFLAVQCTEPKLNDSMEVEVRLSLYVHQETITVVCITSFEQSRPIDELKLFILVVQINFAVKPGLIIATERYL